MVLNKTDPDLYFDDGKLWWDETKNDGKGGWTGEQRPLSDEELQALQKEMDAKRAATRDKEYIGDGYAAGIDIIIDKTTYNSVEMVDLTRRNQIPQHTIEHQYQIADHLIQQPPRFVFTIKAGKTNGEYENLKSLASNRDFIEITTPFGHYKNMLVEDIRFTVSDSKNRVLVTLTVREVKIGTVSIMISSNLLLRDKVNAATDASIIRKVNDDPNDPLNINATSEFNDVNQKLKVTFLNPAGTWLDDLNAKSPTDCIVRINESEITRKPRIFPTTYTMYQNEIYGTREAIITAYEEDQSKTGKLELEGNAWQYTLAKAMQTVEDRRLLVTEEEV